MRSSAILMSLGVFLAILSFCTTAWAVTKKDVVDAVRRNEAGQIANTQKLVQIEAYNQVGVDYVGPFPAQGVADSLTYVMELAEGMGFKTVLHNGWDEMENVRGPLYGYVEYGPKDAPEMIMSLAHLDTVPPGEASLWTLGGAYEAKIVTVDGEERMIGRGVYDDKGPALASLYALKAIKDADVPLTRRIRVFFGTTEDYGGWRCVAAYAAEATAGREEWPALGFSPDSGSFQPTYIEKSSVNVVAQNPIAAAAGSVRLVKLQGGTAGNAVSDKCVTTLEGTTKELTAVKAAMETAIAEKGWHDGNLPIAFTLADGRLDIDVTGVPTHSGVAWEGIGANNRMMYLLSRAPIDTDWRDIAEKVTVLLPPDEDEEKMGEALGIHEGGTEHHDLVTVNMGFVWLDDNDGDGVGDTIRITANIRYADRGADILTGTKHRSGEEIRRIVTEKFAAKGLEATVTGGGYPYTVPMDSEIIVKLQKSYEEITGAAVTPCITMGGTYAAAWRNSRLSGDGDETFGNRMVSWGIDGGIGMHEANESMSIPKLIEATEIMALAMISLAGGTLDVEP